MQIYDTQFGKGQDMGYENCCCVYESMKRGSAVVEALIRSMICLFLAGFRS